MTKAVSVDTKIYLLAAVVIDLLCALLDAVENLMVGGLLLESVLLLRQKLRALKASTDIVIRLSRLHLMKMGIAISATLPAPTTTRVLVVLAVTLAFCV
jgi:uncharacterized membrane protein